MPWRCVSDGCTQSTYRRDKICAICRASKRGKDNQKVSTVRLTSKTKVKDLPAGKFTFGEVVTMPASPPPSKANAVASTSSPSKDGPSSPSKADTITGPASLKEVYKVLNDFRDGLALEFEALKGFMSIGDLHGTIASAHALLDAVKASKESHPYLPAFDSYTLVALVFSGMSLSSLVSDVDRLKGVVIARRGLNKRAVVAAECKWINCTGCTAGGGLLS